MSGSRTMDETFENKDFSEHPLPAGEYDTCVFRNCDFSNSDLSERSFAECEFEGCNLSNAQLHETALKDVEFKSCKLLGLHFDDCRDFMFEVRFIDCQLDLSSFFQRKMPGSTFTRCSLKEVDFVDANLTRSRFAGCDLSGAQFDNTLLEKADFRTAIGFVIDPDANHIQGARFSTEGLPGLLNKYRIEID